MVTVTDGGGGETTGRDTGPVVVVVVVGGSDAFLNAFFEFCNNSDRIPGVSRCCGFVDAVDVVVVEFKVVLHDESPLNAIGIRKQQAAANAKIMTMRRM